MMQKDVRDALRVDEVGIETAVLADYRLSSAYRPVFRRFESRLEMTAAEAVTITSGKGREDVELDLRNAFAPPRRQLAADICQALHIANYRNLDVADCDLIVAHALSRNQQLFDAIEAARAHAEAVGFDTAAPRRIICNLDEAPPLCSSSAERALAELRQAGFRVAADLFARPGGEASHRMDVVIVAGAWPARIAREPAAVALLHQAAARHQADGTCVMMGGIQSPEGLELALRIGADYLSGDFLAPPVPAGAAIEGRSLSIGDMPRSPRKAPAEAETHDAAILRFDSARRRC